MPLVEASVLRHATFAEAADELTKRKLSAIAVVDDDGAVVGLFGGDELLGGLFPPYLADLHHTAFAPDDTGILARRAEQVRGEPIDKHMRKPVTVEAETSAIHVAEVFLHSRVGAIAVVADGKLVGMLDLEDFCRSVVKLPPLA